VPLLSNVNLLQRIIGSRRRRLLILGSGAVVCAGLLSAAYVIHKHRPGNVFHPHVVFNPRQPVIAVATGRAAQDWPLYGYSSNHTRYFPSGNVRPPYRRAWIFAGGSLLEFPPVLRGATLFQLNDDGQLNAINKNTGKARWSRRLGTLAAASPAASSDTVYVTLLDHGNGKGRIIALRQSDGAIRWARDLPSRSESSPLLDGGRLYVGSENGTVYALSAADGHVLWMYHADGAVKASPTLQSGNLYFGDYGDHMQAVRASDGRLVWRVSYGSFLSGGSFYATPAAAFGRIYVGNTDGRVYAFDERNGRLAWAHQTGNYVYSSAAVENTPGLGPTIYAGSYDGNFYALDAYSGSVRWVYHAGGRISGSPAIVGDIVYFADLGRRKTIGLSARGGWRVWSLNTGSFDPVISDGMRLYVTGYYGLYGLDPQRPARQAAAAKGARAAPAMKTPDMFRWPPNR
jgi:outer membrane protein assembly factor BamB